MGSCFTKGAKLACLPEKHLSRTVQSSQDDYSQAACLWGPLSPKLSLAQWDPQQDRLMCPDRDNPEETPMLSSGNLTSCPP